MILVYKQNVKYHDRMPRHSCVAFRAREGTMFPPGATSILVSGTKLLSTAPSHRPRGRHGQEYRVKSGCSLPGPPPGRGLRAFCTALRVFCIEHYSKKVPGLVLARDPVLRSLSAETRPMSAPYPQHWPPHCETPPRICCPSGSAAGRYVRTIRRKSHSVCRTWAPSGGNHR